MTDGERQILSDLNRVLQSHGALWQDIFPVLAEFAEEQCICEPDPAIVAGFLTASEHLREAAKAIVRT